MLNYKITLLLILLFFTNIIYSQNSFFQATNIVDSFYLNKNILNPASVLNDRNLNYYSFSLKNIMTLEHYSINIPYDNLNFNISGEREKNYFKNSINLNTNLKNIITLGMAFNLIYTNLSSHNIYHNINMGISIQPFNKSLKEAGQYVDMFFSLYAGNLNSDPYIQRDFPLYYGGGIGFFYKKDLLKIQIMMEKKDENITPGLNFNVKLYNHHYLNGSLTMHGLSFTGMFEFKDLKIMPSFFCGENEQNFKLGFVIIPGMYKKSIIDDLINEALNEYRKKNYDKALNYFLKANALDKKNREVEQFITIIKERISEKKKTEVNIKILHILKLLKAKRVTLALKEFENLKKEFPEFEYKWKILYNKFEKNKKEKKIEREVMPVKEEKSDVNELLKEVKNLLSMNNLIEAKRKYESITNISDKDRTMYEEIGKLLDEKITSEKEKLLSTLNDNTSENEKIKIYEKILNSIDPNDIHKKEVINFYMKKGEDFYRKNKYNEAIKMWQNVLKYDKNNSDALIYIETTKKKIDRTK